MLRTIGFAMVAAALMSFTPTTVEAQKKKAADVPADQVAEDKDYKALKDTKDMTGLLGSLGTSTMMFRLDIPKMEPNPNYKPPKGNNQNSQMQNLYRQQAKIMANPNPIQRQMQMQQLQMQMQKLQQGPQNTNPNNQPYRTAHTYKDYDFELSEKLHVRKMFLEQEYDDKGNLKTYTEEEKSKLKGKDSSRPGYIAKLEDVQPNQKIKIYLAMPRKTKPAADKDADKTEKADTKTDAVKAAEGEPKVDKADLPAKKGADKADKGAKPAEEVVKPIVTMIVILEQAPVVDRAQNQPKKKKNN